MEVVKKSDFTFEKMREMEEKGGKAEAYIVNGEEWVYIIYPMTRRGE